MSKCEKCRDTYYLRGSDDLWVPCKCLLLKKMEDWSLSGLPVQEIQEGSEDLLIVAKDGRDKELIDALVWNQLKKDVDSEFAHSYSGDMSSLFLLSGRKETFLSVYQNPDVLFIRIITGEAFGKLTGVVVNQVWEFRQNEGLTTHFIAPYGGPKLFKRYPSDESSLGEKLRKLRVIS